MRYVPLTPAQLALSPLVGGFDLQLFAQSPAFETNSVGIVAETGFAVQGTSGFVWLSAQDADFHGVNEFLDRGSARGVIGREPAATGAFNGVGTATIELDGDVAQAIFALALGAEQVVANAGNAAATPLAYDHTFTLGSPRKTFTAQWNKKLTTLAAIGNKIGSLQLSASPKAILLAKIATEYVTEARVAVPGTPSFSVVKPFRFEDPGNSAFVGFNGAAGAASTSGILSWNCTLNTGLQGGEQTFGGGRGRTSTPETQSKASGDALVQFETEDLQRAFWGAQSATGPQTTVQPISLVYTWAGSDAINANVAYRLQVILGYCLITEVPTPGRMGSLLQQNVKYETYETIPGGADDIKVVLTSAQATAF